MKSADTPLSFFFLNAWDWDASKILGCFGLIAVFYFWTKFKYPIQTLLFISGVALLFLSLASPLDALSDEYLFSAHMLQHLLLLMIVPPLLILGLPREETQNLLSNRFVSKIEIYLGNPIFSWIFANFVLWIWHVPMLYDRTIENESLHIFEHLTFLVSATIFWWPVLSPVPGSHLSFGGGMAYLFLAALSNMAIGIFLTFAANPAYEPYLQPKDSWKILATLRSGYHLDPLTDQTLGGVLMWVIGGFVFLFVILIRLSRWYASPEQEINFETGKT